MEATELKGTLEQVLKLLGLDFSDISATEKNGVVFLDIVSAKASRIIGWHGETLNSIQHLLKCMARTMYNLEESPAVIVDVDGYRKQQEEKVIDIAKRKIEFVRRSGKRIALPPMSPYFRRAIHMFIANDPNYTDITTESIGRADQRQIVLRLKDENAALTPNNNDSGSEELIPESKEDNEEWGNLDV